MKNHKKGKIEHQTYNKELENQYQNATKHKEEERTNLSPTGTHETVISASLSM